MKKRRFGRKWKRGASLMVVLVATTVLVIMGTLFTVVAMRSYNYSFSKMCKQQAYYTATSALQMLYNNLYTEVSTNDSSEPVTVISLIVSDLEREIDSAVVEDGADISTISVTVGEIGGSSTAGGVISSGGMFASLMGKCTIVARYTSKLKNEISLEAHATYNGYTSTARSLIVNTSKAAAELKKIFDNTMCLQSPISTIVASQVKGDIFVSSPGTYNRDDNTGQILNTAENVALRNNVYGTIQAGVGESSATVHTKPLDFDNTELKDVSGNTYYNDWVELYMFSDDPSNGYEVLDGNIYANSRILIGMWDKDDTDRKHINTWNSQTLRRGTREISSGYEHGNVNIDALFDHYKSSNKVPVYASTFRVNGDLWLFKDARIENFDSTRTQNAYNGVKNNIYAQKNLYIDGYCYQTESILIWEDKINRTSEVSIFGDVMVQGNLYIANATVFGDIYCNGSTLTMVDCTVYGNVYFAGSEFTADNTTITSGTFNKTTVDSIPNSVNLKNKLSEANMQEFPSNVNISMPGGNVIIKGNTNYTKDPRGYGAVLTNCAVSGTLYSNTSVNLISAKVSDDQGVESNYGNVIVNGDVQVDLTRMYSQGYVNKADTSNRSSDAAKENKIEIDLVVANKLTMTANQYGNEGIEWWVSSYIAKSEVTTIVANYVEIDGNERGISKNESQSFFITNLYCDGTNNNDKIYDTSITNLYCSASSNMLKKNNNKVGTKYFVDNAWAKGIQNLFNLQSGTVYNYFFNSAANAFNSNPGKTSADKELNFTLGFANGAKDVVNWTTYGYPDDSEWGNKEITLYNWNAPAAATEGEIVGTFSKKVAYTEVASVDDLLNKMRSDSTIGNYNDQTNTLTIKTSLIFSGKADFSAYKNVIFDNSAGNLHIQCKAGLVFGQKGNTDVNSPSRVQLQGGNMVFFYISEEKSNPYDVNNPDIVVNDNTIVGGSSEYAGELQVNDLYIVSNKDILITFGQNYVFNGFIYAPKGHLYIAPATGTRVADRCVVNGCMAIEGFIFENIQTGKTTWQNIVSQYTYCLYNYVQPQLIIDVGLVFGNTLEDQVNFGQAVWEFLGYY